MRWSATPICRSPTATCSTGSPCRGRPAGARTRPAVCCGSPASGGCRRPEPRTTTSTSAPTGTERSGSIIHDGVRMADPSILVTLHCLDDPTLAPAGCTSIYVLEPAPNLDGAVDWSARARPDRRRPRRAGRRRSGIRPTSMVERIYDPQDWQALGMERGTPFALAHTFRQTGPFRPGNVDRGCPGLVFVGFVARCPASACRWCWCRASWRPSDVRQFVTTR